MKKKTISTKPLKSTMEKSNKVLSKNDMAAAKKARQAGAPLVPNRLPFDQGTSI